MFVKFYPTEPQQFQIFLTKGARAMVLVLLLDVATNRAALRTSTGRPANSAPPSLGCSPGKEAKPTYP